MNTLQEAGDYLRSNWKKGVECPCCHQFVKLYKRTITSTMAYQLILLYKHFERNPGKEFVHVSNTFADLKVPPAVKSGMGDFAKLEYWGLIKHATHLREDGSKRNGYWGITSSGKQFVKEQLSVDSEVYIYDGKVKKMAGPSMTISDALRKKFDYSELMNGV